MRCVCEPQSRGPESMRKYFRYTLRLFAYVCAIGIPFLIDHAFLVTPQDMCRPKRLESSTSGDLLETAIYNTFTAYSFHPKRRRYTTVVALRDADLPDHLFSDKCEQRQFLAQVIVEAQKEGASMIAIDKYFSTEGCTDRKATEALVKAIGEASNNIPVVVGVNTDTADDAERRSQDFPRIPVGEPIACQKETARLDLIRLAVPYQKLGARGIHEGLLRLNADVRKIPLAWSVFTAAPPVQTVRVQSLALAASVLWDRELLSRPAIRRDLDVGKHPLTSFITVGEPNGIPTVRAADLACRSGLVIPEYNCKNPNLANDLLGGRIVLIGDDTREDRHLTPVGDLAGVYVQANYIESLLDDRYFKTGPSLWELVSVLIWIALIEVTFLKTKSYAAEARAAITLATTIAALLFVSWIVFQLTGFLFVAGVPSAFVFLVFRYFESLKERAAETPE
jgi:hypothetical protein